ncbi:MAG TPA: YqaA family protein [Acidobacteriota bacterium]|jgi:membrane protein YqaA with SNARE-associated domain
MAAETEATLGLLQRLYEWVLHWAHTPYGVPALALLSFAESSFFPIPPDVLLMALAFSRPRRAFWYAGICSVASVLGGMAGYGLGYFLFEALGRPILEFYGHGAESSFLYLQELYRRWDAWAVLVAAFTPIPYKVFTIAGGLFRIDFPVFVLASTVGRAGRFFLVAAVIYFFGPSVRGVLERHLNRAVWLLAAGLIGGFVLLKYVLD